MNDPPSGSNSGRVTRTTIRDVAERAGVSTATVSYVLNGTGSVSAATAERVRQCVDELGYRANSLAIAHRTGRTRTIGLALPDLANPFHSEFARGVHRAAAEEGFAVFLLDGDNSAVEQDRSIDMVVDRVPEGLIVTPVTPESISSRTFPFPVVVCDVQIPGYDSIQADIRGGGELQAELVRDHGHKRVGLVTGPEDVETAQLRRDGFIDTLDDGIDLVWEIPLDFLSTIPGEAAERITSSDVTCVVAGNDLQAIGLLHAYRRAGVSVPSDVSLIGFDDISFGEVVTPALTTIRLPQQELGAAAFRALCDRLADPDAPVRHEILDVTVTMRESLIHLDS